MSVFSQGPETNVYPLDLSLCVIQPFWQRALISIGLKQPSAHTFDPISMKGPYTQAAAKAFSSLLSWGW